MKDDIINGLRLTFSLLLILFVVVVLLRVIIGIAIYGATTLPIKNPPPIASSTDPIATTTDPTGIILTFTINKDGDTQSWEWRGVQNTIDLHNAFWMVGNYFGGEERFFRQVDDPNSYPPEEVTK